MKRVKKTIFLLLLVCGIGAFLLSGCGTSPKKNTKLKQWIENSSQLRVLCTTAQVGDLVSQVGGDKVKVIVLIQGETDPHSYELVKGDDEKIARADQIFYSGLHLEHGASLSACLEAHKNAFAVSDAIQANFPHKILKKGNVIDPHLWMDISVWKLGVSPIAEALSLKDPENASYYKANALSLEKTMEEAHERMKEKIGRIPPEKRYLLTSHDAFRYFAKGYLTESMDEGWEERFAAPEGLAPDGQLSSMDIQRMIDFLRKYRISVLFPESNVSRDSIQKIADAGRELQLDIRVCYEPLYGDSMGSGSYLEMMERNGDVIVRHLQ